MENRLKELREEKDVSKEELAKVLRLNIKEYSKKENTGFYPNELEKLAIRLDVPRSYLNGNTNYLSKGEREYRKKIKEAAKKEFENFKANCPYDDFDDAISPRVSAMAQLCTAANLIRVTESIEELSDKVSDLNDTIYSYGMWASGQPR